MAREIPEVVRAAAGLAATVLDEARKLPETLPGLPVRVIGLAMQSALKVQQHYAGFVARGDELFIGLRGEDEPGLATFDDDLDEAEAAPASNGYRESAFDRADALTEVPLTEDEGDLPAADLGTPDAGAAPAAQKTARKKAAQVATSAKAAKPARAPRAPRTAAADAMEQVGSAQETLDALPTQAPSTEEVLEELAIDEMVGDAPVSVADSAPAGTPDADGPDSSGSGAPRTAPVADYDDFSIAQLRGRLRGYALSTVSDLVVYEQANRAREPYLRMLRNRLEKVQDQAVEASPLAPRGA